MNGVSAVWLALAYLVGGIPFGYLIGRMNGVDVRTVGSKNIGATNVFRTVGKKWGFAAFALDVLKGLLPTLAARHFAPEAIGPVSMPLAVGLACVLGHMLTPYMRFRGGKGVATAFGVFFALMPALVGIAFVVFCVLFASTHYISLGSCGAAVFLGVAVWLPLFGRAPDVPTGALVTAIAFFIVWKHSANIGRLVRGEENKIYLSGKKEKRS
jgi:glycerol-3-phosphate acyltransferase PlsY